MFLFWGWSGDDGNQARRGAHSPTKQVLRRLHIACVERGRRVGELWRFAPFSQGGAWGGRCYASSEQVGLYMLLFGILARDFEFVLPMGCEE